MSTATTLRSRQDVLVSVLFLYCLLVGCLGFLLAVRFLQPEHVFVFNPSIDTTFAPGYTETQFDAVRKGMPASEVTRLVGEPLDTREGLDGGEIWQYTEDGASPVWDFAWLVREIHVHSNGTVTRVVKDIRYD